MKVAVRQHVVDISRTKIGPGVQLLLYVTMQPRKLAFGQQELGKGQSRAQWPAAKKTHKNVSRPKLALYGRKSPD